MKEKSNLKIVFRLHGMFLFDAFWINVGYSFDFIFFK